MKPPPFSLKTVGSKRQMSKMAGKNWSGGHLCRLPFAGNVMVYLYNKWIFPQIPERPLLREERVDLIVSFFFCQNSCPGFPWGLIKIIKLSASRLFFCCCFDFYFYCRCKTFVVSHVFLRSAGRYYFSTVRALTHKIPKLMRHKEGMVFFLSRAWDIENFEIPVRNQISDP